MRTRLLPLAPLAATLVALAAPAAVADNQSVKAKPDNVFSPRIVAVKPGESVTWTNDGGQHNVVWNDGTPAQPPDAADPSGWPAGGVSRTFQRSGKFRYYCVLHGDRSSNVGMFGYVYVNPAGLTPPIVTGLTASATRTAVRLRFRASRAGKAKVTFLRKTRSGRFKRSGTTSFSARQGLTSKRLARSLSKGTWRVEIVVTDVNRLSSDKQTKTFTVR